MPYTYFPSIELIFSLMFLATIAFYKRLKFITVVLVILSAILAMYFATRGNILI